MLVSVPRLSVFYNPLRRLSGQATFFAWANDALRYEEDSLRAVVIASMNAGSGTYANITIQRLPDGLLNLISRRLKLHRIAEFCSRLSKYALKACHRVGFQRRPPDSEQYTAMRLSFQYTKLPSESHG